KPHPAAASPATSSNNTNTKNHRPLLLPLPEAATAAAVFGAAFAVGEAVLGAACLGGALGVGSSSTLIWLISPRGKSLSSRLIVYLITLLAQIAAKETLVSGIVNQLIGGRLLLAVFIGNKR